MFNLLKAGFLLEREFITRDNDLHTLKIVKMGGSSSVASLGSMYTIHPPTLNI